MNQNELLEWLMRLLGDRRTAAGGTSFVPQASLSSFSSLGGRYPGFMPSLSAALSSLGLNPSSILGGVSSTGSTITGPLPPAPPPDPTNPYSGSLGI